VTGSGNTITATGQIALNVVGTTIGAGGLTFRTISANGGSNGIILDNTGLNGGLTVTGTGSTAASGGTIVGMTGADGTTAGIGIYLNNTRDISLSNMTLTGTFGNFGIFGASVTNFTLRDSSLTGVYGSNEGLQEATIRFGTQAAGGVGLSGSALIEGNVIAGGRYDNVSIFNNAASTLSLTVQDSTNDAAIFGHNHTTAGNDALLVEVRDGATASVVVSGVTFNGARGDMFQSSTQGAATSNVTVTGNTFNNTHPDITSGGGGIAITGGQNPSSYNITYNITGNTHTGSEGTEIFISLVGSSGTVSGVIQNNTIGTDEVGSNPESDGSGTSAGGNGIDIRLEKFAGAGTLTHAVRIQGNTIRDVSASGIYIRSNNQGSGTGRTEATILSNTIEEVSGVTFGGISVIAGGSAVGDTGRGPVA